MAFDLKDTFFHTAVAAFLPFACWDHHWQVRVLTLRLSLHGCSWGVWLQLLCLYSQGLKLLSYLPVSKALPASPDVQPHPLVVIAAHRLYQTTESGWEETAGSDKGAPDVSAPCMINEKN